MSNELVSEFLYEGHGPVPLFCLDYMCFAHEELMQSYSEAHSKATAKLTAKLQRSSQQSYSEAHSKATAKLTEKLQRISQQPPLFLIEIVAPPV